MEAIIEIYEKSKSAGRPLAAHFELTKKCNLKCRHCYIAEESESELDTAGVKDALRKLAQAGVLFLTLTGGEPLVRDDFFEIAGYARELNFSVRVFTNGTLVGSAAADKLAELNLFEAGVSVYGACAATHDSITGEEGSFEKTMLGIRLLRERGVRLALKSVIMKPNFGEYGELIGMAEELGARYVFDPTVTPRDDGGSAPLELRISDAQLEAVMCDPRFGPQGGALTADRACRGPVCDLNIASIAVSPGGTVFPCLQLKLPCGNIVTDDFEEIKFKLKSHVTYITDNLSEKCYNCKIKHGCTRCPGLALLEDGDVLGASAWACRMARIRERTRINGQRESRAVARKAQASV